MLVNVVDLADERQRFVSFSMTMSSSPSLLDDDPFANLADPSSRPSTPDRSSCHAQLRPAHTKPAFATRPSLPSLHTLAQLNMSVPARKVRKGTPGARLPHEPWDIDLNAELPLLSKNRQSNTRTLDPPLSEHASPPADPLADIRLVSQESALNPHSLTDETASSRSLSADDADMDALPSLSFTSSEPSSSTPSRSSSICSSFQLEHAVGNDHGDDSMVADDMADEDDPLSYHSDFDYYTQSLSDLSDSEPDLDPDADTKASNHVGITPFPSLYDPVVDIVSRTSVDTMRRLSADPTRTIGSPNPESPQDSGGWRGQRSQPERQSGREDEGRGREPARRHGDQPSSSHSSGAFGGGGGGDDNNGDKARQSKPRLSSSSSDFTSSSDDDADNITVYYSLDGMSNDSPPRAQSRTHSRYSKADAGSDDDVPLAQRVPTALSAQKSIRRQLHDERKQRKLERAKSTRAAQPVHPSEPLRATAPTGPRKRSISAAPAPTSGPRFTPPETFPIEDLTRKLANLQNITRTPAHDSFVPSNATPRGPSHASGISRSPSRGRYTDQGHLQRKNSSRVPEPSSQDRPLRPMRSFHRTNGRHVETQPSPEYNSNARLGRSATSASSSRAPRAVHDSTPTGHDHYAKLGRPSEDSRRPSASLPRTSVDDVLQRAVQRPPVPPLPISDSTPPQLMSRITIVQQRIFIENMQRFNMVEITPATNAGDVIDAVASQGMLNRSGSWMLFEVAQDYGMERPVREYELLSDVTASWNKDKLLNAFVIKQTSLAQILSRSSIPTSSPTHRGWVEWESKRGKWSKRWMELREHGLWLSKRDTGKDEIFLCSLSNFDAYNMTRKHKSPKPYVFAVKSTDHPSLFENVADYVHVFSCNPKDGESWMQAILVARSYVLYQERNVLFAKPGESLSQGKPLSRSRTRKMSVSRPAQPLVSVPPPFSQSTTANVAFEPGSLLAKRKTADA